MLLVMRLEEGGDLRVVGGLALVGDRADAGLPEHARRRPRPRCSRRAGAAAPGAAPLTFALNEVSEVPCGMVSARLFSMNDQRTSPPMAQRLLRLRRRRGRRAPWGRRRTWLASAASVALRAVARSSSSWRGGDLTRGHDVQAGGGDDRAPAPHRPGRAWRGGPAPRWAISSGMRLTRGNAASCDGADEETAGCAAGVCSGASTSAVAPLRPKDTITRLPSRGRPGRRPEARRTGPARGRAPSCPGTAG